MDNIEEKMSEARIILSQAISTRKEFEYSFRYGILKKDCPRLVLRKGHKAICEHAVYKEGVCKYHYYKKRRNCVQLKVYKSTRRY
jgi:hypothetical protein